VRLWGPLDDESVGLACAELMALDATGDGAVQLYVASTGGPLHLALTLIDTIDLLGVPVHVTCLGRADGAAVGVVAAGTRRVAAPHAQFHMSEPEVSATGNANQLAAWAEHHRVQLERFVRRLAEATGRAAEHVEADLCLGRWLDADQALQYGLVDEIWAPGRPPMGEQLPPRAPQAGGPPGPGGSVKGPTGPTGPSSPSARPGAGPSAAPESSTGPARPFGFRPNR
jgi:ATP-dependent Clp protease, protease subunit